MDSSGHRERRPWSEDEDRLLREAIQREDPGASPPSKWHAIATHVPNRTNKDCRKRWWAQMATTVAKGGWSHEEDDRLTAAVEEFGTKWALVATRVATRNSGQCAKRWNDALNPNIDRSEWTDEEDVKLLEAVKQQGKAWTNIVRTSLPGRTGLSAKNRYNHLTRATTERSRDRRKPSATVGAPYSRPGVGQLPPPASTSTGSTPPHMSRDHSPLTPADSQPFYAQHTHHAFPGAKPEPDGYPRPEYERPNLTLAPPGAIPVQDRLGYSPHNIPGVPGMYPTPHYRLTDPSPTHSPRSAYPAPGQGYFTPPPHAQPSEIHRGGYHSGPATPAPPHEQPPAQHNGSFFGAPSQLTGLPQMSRQPMNRAPTLASYTGHYDPRSIAPQHVQQQQQHQQHQHQQHQQHYESQQPPPPHSAAADSHQQFRLPSMQAATIMTEWTQ